MHEMALAASILGLLEDQARRDHFERVRALRLAIGVLSHVDPRALEFGLQSVVRGTILEGAKVVIERPGGTAYCMDCSDTIEVSAHGDACPRCGGNKWVLVSGDEMRVLDMEVD